MTALRHAMLRSSLIAVLAIVSVTGGSAAESQRYDFNRYLAEGYRQMADVAERSAGHAAFAAYFEQRRALAIHRRPIHPEALDGRNLDAFTLREAGFARRELIARLDAGARQRQPLLAAIAQVNFDCWVAPLPKQLGVPDSDECRRRFYFAFAGLVPAPAGQAPSGVPAPSAPLESVQVASSANVALPAAPSTLVLAASARLERTSGTGLPLSKSRAPTPAMRAGSSPSWSPKVELTAWTRDGRVLS